MTPFGCKYTKMAFWKNVFVLWFLISPDEAYAVHSGQQEKGLQKGTAACRQAGLLQKKIPSEEMGL